MKDIIKIFYNSSHPNISYLKNNLNRKVKLLNMMFFLSKKIINLKKLVI